MDKFGLTSAEAAHPFNTDSRDSPLSDSIHTEGLVVSTSRIYLVSMGGPGVEAAQWLPLVAAEAARVALQMDTVSRQSVEIALVP